MYQLQLCQQKTNLKLSFFFKYTTKKQPNNYYFISSTIQPLRLNFLETKCSDDEVRQLHMFSVHFPCVTHFQASLNKRHDKFTYMIY